MKKFYFTILDEALKQNKYSRVAVETFASANQITIAGQLTTNAKLDIEKIVRDRIKEIGYDNAELDMDYRTCKIDINITKQSSDIAQGVDVGGAGDQGIMFGYASDETEEYMPFVISTQHNDGIDMDALITDIKDKVINEVIPQKYLDENTKYYINPTGRFVIGGPLGDTGLTGRKIIVDTYGGYARHGGGAFSGKDATKVDRSAAYMLRHIAKNIVANGYAKKCELQVAYAIGVEQPMSIFVDTFGTNAIPEEEIEEKIRNKFDLTPKGIIEYLGLREPIFTKTTNYGHFGKPELPWEKVIKM